MVRRIKIKEKKKIKVEKKNKNITQKQTQKNIQKVNINIDPSIIKGRKPVKRKAVTKKNISQNALNAIASSSSYSFNTEQLREMNKLQNEILRRDVKDYIQGKISNVTQPLYITDKMDSSSYGDLEVPPSQNTNVEISEFESILGKPLYDISTPLQRIAIAQDITKRAGNFLDPNIKALREARINELRQQGIKKTTAETMAREQYPNKESQRKKNLDKKKEEAAQAETQQPEPQTQLQPQQKTKKLKIIKKE